MPKDPRIKALASQAAIRIKALTDIHQTQIEAIYQKFREQAAIIQEGNVDSLDTCNVTPTQPTTSDQRENYHATE